MGRAREDTDVVDARSNKAEGPVRPMQSAQQNERARRVFEALQAPSSGARTNLRHYLNGETTLKVLTRSVLVYLGENKDDWEQWRDVVRDAAGKGVLAGNTKLNKANWGRNILVRSEDYSEQQLAQAIEANGHIFSAEDADSCTTINAGTVVDMFLDDPGQSLHISEPVGPVEREVVAYLERRPVEEPPNSLLYRIARYFAVRARLDG